MWILKNFLFEQTDVPQGDPGRNPNFINPEYIIEGIKQSRKSIDISVLDNCFNTGHWKKRYSIFETYKDTWCNLANYVLEEDKEIEKIISKIKNHLILLGYAENLNHLKNEDDLISNIESFFSLIFNRFGSSIYITFEAHRFNACAACKTNTEKHNK